MDVSLSELRELVMDREAWRAVIHGIAKSRTWLSDWTELNWGRSFQLRHKTKELREMIKYTNLCRQKIYYKERETCNSLVKNIYSIHNRHSDNIKEQYKY